jgi:hypothetical protein
MAYLHKKWQNLVGRCCPFCDGPLDALGGRTDLFRCRTKGCDFVISRHGMLAILADDTHILRNYLTAEDTIMLANTVRALRDGTEARDEP